MKLSIVVPCYNEAKVIPIFYKEIIKVIDGYDKVSSLEILFIDDGSSDSTYSEIKRLAENDKQVRYVSFSRNFGKEAALLAGLEEASGDLIATMDVDMQDPPGLVPAMIDAILEEGYDCAATRRVTRKGEPPIRSFFARRFYSLMNKISDVQIVDGARDFRVMKRQMVDSIISLSERNRFSKGIFAWVGYNTRWFDYENQERAAGETKWSFLKLFIYSLDGIVAFSTFPLHISSIFGFAFSLLAFIGMIFFLIKTFIFGDPVAGYPSMIITILFLGGIQLLTIGILGLYLSKTYIESKQRPLYIIKDKI
jgi:glucosyltransferase